MNQTEEWEKAERLREAVDDSSRAIRNIYIFFLLLATYIAVIIGSTTDGQLLKISPIKLPLLDVALPIVGFYALIPWLFVLLLFNLLLELYLLSEKLHVWEKTIYAFNDETMRQEQFVRLYPFPFNHMIIGKHHSRLIRLLFGIVVWVTVILLPISLLLWAQVRFLPYHDVIITWIQRLALYLEIVLLLVFWPKIVEPNGRASRWWGRLLTAPWWARLVGGSVERINHLSAFLPLTGEH